jgi:protein ImuB
LRDYFIARSEHAGLLWIYRERFATSARDEPSHAGVRWYLQGFYA